MGQAWDSGGAGIRTQETLARPTVFKTAPFDRSGTPPSGSVYGATPRERMLGGRPLLRHLPVGVLDARRPASSGEDGRKIDRDEPAHEPLCDLALERDAVAPRSYRGAQRVAYLTAALEMGCQIDCLPHDG